MAGFEVITYGRFWVIAEAATVKPPNAWCVRYVYTHPLGMLVTLDLLFFKQIEKSPGTYTGVFF